MPSQHGGVGVTILMAQLGALEKVGHWTLACGGRDSDQALKSGKRHFQS